ncbi:MAG: sulfatase-like hydrolase/transferase [Candidatus Micrarchaeaceae archaeon]
MTKDRKDVIVLMMDTVRAEDVYRNPQLSTLNRIARNASNYTHAVSSGSWTVPTHASLFTNRKVSDIKQVSRDFLKNGTNKIDPWMVKTKFLSENENTLSRKLSNYGYQSVLLSNNPFLTSFTNLGLGFDKIHDVWLNSNVKYNKSLARKLSFILEGGASARIKMIYTAYLLTRFLPKSTLDKLYVSARRRMNQGVAKADGTNKLDRGAIDTNKLLNAYLTYDYNYRPQFIFINYMEAHENYPLNDMGIPQDKWLYLGGVEEMSDYNMHKLHKGYLRRLKYLDKSINSTIEILKQKGLLENSTILFTSDHGQLFGEHGLLYHSLPPYEQISRVPLLAANYENGKLVKMKDTVDTPVSTSALHDSILDLAEGKYKYLDGNIRKDRYVISEHTGISEGWDEKLLSMLAPRAKSAAAILKAKRKLNMKVTAIYKGDMKLMHYFGRRKDELYEVSKDPQETTNIINSNRTLALEMANSLHDC